MAGCRAGGPEPSKIIRRARRPERTGDRHQPRIAQLYVDQIPVDTTRVAGSLLGMTVAFSVNGRRENAAAPR